MAAKRQGSRDAVRVLTGGAGHKIDDERADEQFLMFTDESVRRRGRRDLPWPAIDWSEDSQCGQTRTLGRGPSFGSGMTMHRRGVPAGVSRLRGRNHYGAGLILSCCEARRFRERSRRVGCSESMNRCGGLCIERLQ